MGISSLFAFDLLYQINRTSRNHFIFFRVQFQRQVIEVQRIGVAGLPRHGPYQADAQGVLVALRHIVHRVERAAVIPEAQHPILLFMQDTHGQVMLFAVLAETVLNGVAGHFLDAQGDMAAHLSALAMAEAELTGLFGYVGHFLHGIDIRLYQIQLF